MRILFGKSLCPCILFFCCIFTGCGGESGSAPSSSEPNTIRRPIAVVATVGMVADLVRNIGGDLVKVTQIMGSGVDPHLHKTTPDDMRLIMGADLLFYSGLMLEGKMSSVLSNRSDDRLAYAVAESLAKESLLVPKDASDHQDPHVWMDVSAWSKCSMVVTEALVAYDPENAEQYRRQAASFQSRLAALHAYGLKVIGTIPESSRVLITSHDAFNYLGRAYGLQVLGVQGISTDSEAGLQRINQLVDLLVDNKIKAVFVESSVSPKNIHALIEGAQQRGQKVVVGGELFSDAMGTLGTYEGTYEGMLDHNLTVIARALGGQAPETGINGKLTP